MMTKYAQNLIQMHVCFTAIKKIHSVWLFRSGSEIKKHSTGYS